MPPTSAHPHLDPRQPRWASRPGTNPPVFVWSPAAGQASFDLQVSHDAEGRDVLWTIKSWGEPMFLPTTALPAGDYHWRWRASGELAWSEAWPCTITEDAAVLEIPPVDEWLRRLPAAHPRFGCPAGAEADWRAAYARDDSAARAELPGIAADLLALTHDFPAPAELPPIEDSYEAWFAVWYEMLWQTRRFVKGAETLALAGWLENDPRFGRAAAQRMASVARWDPDGATREAHNSEAHMSVIWHGPKACDWAWAHFTDEEKTRVIAQYRRRGQIQYASLRDEGYYGITRFDSHAGRKIVFLAMIALVFHEEIPEARGWLEWLRPILGGVWPVWAGDDGAWAEGISYSSAYVGIMAMFASLLKTATGVDLFRRPFWRNHLEWRRRCFPPYAEWMGFGDHSERWLETWLANADLCELISRETGQPEALPYVAAMRAERIIHDMPAERFVPGICSELLLARLGGRVMSTETGPAAPSPWLQVFPAAGWAAIRTAGEDASRDVAFIFRSSPFGSISHSHAANNDFILHVAGRAMAMPSGYYDGYGSNHHAHWVWHTKSHNCVTLSDAGQLMRSPAAAGAIEHPYEDEHVVYLRGNADRSYGERAVRCRRHVLLLKAIQTFVLVDEFVEPPGMVSALQWNLHGLEPFTVDESARAFRWTRGDSRVEGRVLWSGTGFFSQTSGWEPPPMTQRHDPQWVMQHHLRFTPNGFGSRRLGVVLAPSWPGHAVPVLQTGADAGVEWARIGDVRVRVWPKAPGEADGAGVILLVNRAGHDYVVDDAGLRRA